MNLHVLDLSGSTQLEALWRESLHSSTARVPESNLRELNLSGCKSLTELPQFDSCLRKLQWFSIQGCERIDQLDSSIGSLTELTYLDLRGCTRLRSLPDAIKDLRSVQRLLLSHCRDLESLPQGIGECHALIELCLDHTGLSALPESLGNLKMLEKLALNSCPKLTSIPPSIGDLVLLRVCDLSECPRLRDLPDKFCKLINLEDLNLSKCDFEGLSESFGGLRKLKSLSLSENRRMKRLPGSMGELKSLVILILAFCPLQDDGMPEGLQELNNLEDLDMQGTNLTKIPASFAHLGTLSRLLMHHCAKLEEAAFFPGSLTLLDMGHCPSLKKVAGLDGLKSLEHLLLCDCCQLRELSGLAGLDSLRDLNISGCGSLHSSAVLAVPASLPTTLRRLQLSGSQVIPSKRLLQLPRLEHIACFGSQMPADFKNVGAAIVEAVEHANELVMTIDIPASCSRHPCFAIVVCLVSHDQGWSDYKRDHGSYMQSPTFVEGVLLRDGVREGTVRLLYRNRHAELRDQVHLVILRRESHELLKNEEMGDKIEIRARSLYQAWRITVKQASYIVITDELNARLAKIAAGWTMDSINTVGGGQIPHSIHALNIDAAIQAGPGSISCIERQQLLVLMKLWEKFLHESQLSRPAHETNLDLHDLDRRFRSLLECHKRESNLEQVINKLDLDIRFVLQHKCHEWRSQHKSVKDHFVRANGLYFDHRSLDSQSFALLVDYCQTCPPLVVSVMLNLMMLEVWRKLFFLRDDRAVDLQSLPSLSVLMLAQA